MLTLKNSMRGSYALVLLCFASLGYLAIDRLQAVSEKAASTNAIWTPRARIADNLGDATREYRISEALRILSDSPEMATHAEEDLKTNSDLVDSKLLQYRHLLQKNEDSAPIDKVEAAWRKYVSGNRAMAEAAQANHQEEAVNRFRNSASRFYLVTSALDELSSASDANVAADSATAARLFVQARARVLETIAVIALLIAAFVAFFELKVWRVLADLSATMQKIANDELRTEIRGTSRRDEIGEMARAVQVFKDNAIAKQCLETDAARQREALDDQRRAAEEEHRKAELERNLAVGVVARGLAELSKGDLTVRLIEEVAPEFEKLKLDFNSAVDKLRDTMGTLKLSASEIQAGTEEISQSAEDLSRRTEQQAASLEETAAALDGITTTVRRTADGATEASNVVAASKVEAERSGEVMRDAIRGMGEIENSARQISQIIGVIDEIAFQTNLLALNAGVEAARAGEAGKGFAVVATEVRALAQRSAAAAKEIKALISTSTGQVSAGVQLVGQAGQALDRILASFAEINKLVAEIASSAKEQAAGLHEVNSAIVQMDHVTQQNASMVEENTAASFALASESQQLAGLVSRFKLDDGSEPQIKSVQQAPLRAAAPLRRVAQGRGNGGATARKLAAQEWEEF